MAVSARLSKGRKLYMSLDGTTYTQLVDIASMGDMGAGAAPQVDVTPLDTTETRREKLAGMPDTSDFTFEQHYTAARWTTLSAQLATAAPIWWRQTTPQFTATPSQYNFRGTLSELALIGGSNVDDPIRIRASVIVSGSITQVVGS